MRVYLSQAERADAERSARALNTSLSDFLRSAALGFSLRPRLHADAVLVMVDVDADLERVRALLERCLAPRAAGGFPEEEARGLLASLPGLRRRLVAVADAAA